jgi:HAD superfamily hydrolase (TIGR01490 family)
LNDAGASDEAMAGVPLSVFALDGPVVRGEAGALWLSYLAARGVAAPGLVARIALVSVLDRRGVPLDFDRLAREMMAPFRGLPVAGMERALDSFVLNRLVPAVRPEAKRVMETLRARGHRVVLATSAIAPIAERLARHLPVDGWVAPELAPATDGRFAGELAGPVTVGRARLQALERLATRRWPGWRLARVYGDRDSDTALMSDADEPMAVNPAEPFRTMAERRGWPVLEWA